MSHLNSLGEMNKEEQKHQKQSSMLILHSSSSGLNIVLKSKLLAFVLYSVGAIDKRLLA